MTRLAAGALDPFDLDSELDEEHLSIRDAVTSFVEREILPGIGSWFRDEQFHGDLVGLMAHQGLLGATITGYGCAGLDPLAYGIICRELESGDSAFRSFVSVQTSLVMGAIAKFGSPAQKARYLPALAQGTMVGCFGLTESQGGSDPARMRTRAQRVDDGWQLNGSKHWITNAGIADVALVWVRTADSIAAFLVEKGTPGFEQRTIKGKLSLRASNTGEIFLSEVTVADDARLPATEGLKSALSCLDEARFGIVWGAIGAARSCLKETLEYVRDRESFGASLASKQAVQLRLADAVRRLSGATLIAQRLAELRRDGRHTPLQTSLGKWNNVRAALDIARTCRDILGAAGVTTEHATMRHMLNLESVVTYEGTETIHALIAGRSITGESAF